MLSFSVNEWAEFLIESFLAVEFAIMIIIIIIIIIGLDPFTALELKRR